MMSDQASGPRPSWCDDPAVDGQQRWWDGEQWTHTTRPMSDVTRVAPIIGVAAAATAPRPSSGMTTSMKIVLGMIGLLTVLGGCSAAVAILGRDRNGGEQADGVILGPGGVTDTEPSESTQSTEPLETTTEPSVPTAPGTRDDAFPYGQPVDVTWTAWGDADGSIWTTVIGRPRDITDEVLAVTSFNRPPPSGRRFVGFDVDLTLVQSSKEPLMPGFNLRWEIVGGSTSRSHAPGLFGCGLLPDQFNIFVDAFIGGTLSGTICVTMPEEDLDHPDTRVALRFIDNSRTFFG